MVFGFGDGGVVAGRLDVLGAGRGLVGQGARHGKYKGVFVHCLVGRFVARCQAGLTSLYL